MIVMIPSDAGKHSDDYHQDVVVVTAGDAEDA